MAFLTHQFAFYFLFTIFSIFSPCIADYDVHVRNETPDVLTAQCYLDGKDLGKQTINSLVIYRINVPIIDGQPNSVWCAMWLGKRPGLFQIFNYNRDQTSCADNVCHWYVKQDGICLFSVFECAVHYNWAWWFMFLR